MPWTGGQTIPCQIPNSSTCASFGPVQNSEGLTSNTPGRLAIEYLANRYNDACTRAIPVGVYSVCPVTLDVWVSDSGAASSCSR